MATCTQQATNCQLEPWQDLKGKVVMVTGASSGIGWEFCIDLAKAGCKIIAAARRIHRLKSLCDQLNTDGSVIAVPVELDVSAGGPVIEDSVRKAWHAFGRIDALINNAGIRGPYRGPLDLEDDDWDITYRTNAKGSWLVSKYVCQQMVGSNQEGSIINISSISGVNRLFTHGAIAYASSKAALNTMTKVMAMEVGKHKIRVNSVCPGLFKSEITEEIMQKEMAQECGYKNSAIKRLWHH